MMLKYKVDNAIILAAGDNGELTDSKTVFSLPKGLFVVGNETLIERQIRQLKEAGINDITIIIGHKQELFFFLADKWHVNLEINPDLKKNNIFSLYLLRKYLRNTYILNCDNYFEVNPFKMYENESFHATVFKTSTSNELLVKKSTDNRIKLIYSDDKPGECLFGHAFFTADFSEKFINLLNDEIANFRVNKLFWEEFIGKHLDVLKFYAHSFENNIISEFDSIQEIQNVDSLFLDNVSGKITKIICQTLKCKKENITKIRILEKGLTNILFTFVVYDKTYIFRYPGESSRFFIYRENECVAQNMAAKSHVDDTLVYIDKDGIKISTFRENAINLNDIYYYDVKFMETLAKKIRIFHTESQNYSNLSKYNYDPLFECKKLFAEASKTKGDLFKIFKDEWKMIEELKAFADKDNIQKVMCHNDINSDNVLLTNKSFDIIDWEFAGFNDPGYDFGRVIGGSAYEPEDPRIDKILAAYFGRPATKIEKIHWMAYAAIHNWYYVGWALYKESINESSRDWMLFFYTQSKKIGTWSLSQYKKIYSKKFNNKKC